MHNNVHRKEIKKNCILCGNCSAVCPKDAVSYDNRHEKVIIDKNKCINCGICIKNCPAAGKIKKTQTLSGNITGVYAGFSNDSIVRFNSASGGLLTQTLIYLLDNNIVDKVLTADFSGNIFQASSYFTSDIEKIKNACGSKYQIINTNTALKTVLKENLRYAYTGLPCHLLGLEAFLKANPDISDRILYKFSICCSHNTNIQILDYALQKMDIDRKEAVSIRYRGGGWPEYLTIGVKDREQIKFGRDNWNILFSSFFYTPRQCFRCNDFAGETSDISFADAWLEEYTSKKSSGYNLVFSHNEKGYALLKMMQDKAVINISPRSYHDIIKSQIIGLFYKKYLYNSKNIFDILYKNIIKFNSKISYIPLFKYINLYFLKYYVYIISFLFVRKRIKDFKERLLNENSNS